MYESAERFIQQASTPEYIYAEKPTIDQLTSMGWQYIEGSWDNPQVADRENFKQVLSSDRNDFLDILRNFTLLKTSGGRTIKIRQSHTTVTQQRYIAIRFS